MELIAYSVVLVLCLALGTLFIRRGSRAGTGEERHCARCNVLLVGVSEADCSNCGTPQTRKNVILGERRPQFRKFLLGVLMLVASGIVSIPLGLEIYRNLRGKWYYVRPALIVMHDLTGRDGHLNQKAAEELLARIKTDRLSDLQNHQMADALLKRIVLDNKHERPIEEAVDAWNHLVQDDVVTPKQFKQCLRTLNGSNVASTRRRSALSLKVTPFTQ